MECKKEKQFGKICKEKGNWARITVTLKRNYSKRMDIFQAFFVMHWEWKITRKTKMVNEWEINNEMQMAQEETMASKRGIGSI